MTQSSKQSKCAVVDKTQTEMVSVYAGNARSSCHVVGAVAVCCTHAGLQH